MGYKRSVDKVFSSLYLQLIPSVNSTITFQSADLSNVWSTFFLLFLLFLSQPTQKLYLPCWVHLIQGYENVCCIYVLTKVYSGNDVSIGQKFYIIEQAYITLDLGRKPWTHNFVNVHGHGYGHGSLKNSLKLFWHWLYLRWLDFIRNFNYKSFIIICIMSLFYHEYCVY